MGLMQAQPFIMTVLWVIGVGSPVRGPGLSPREKRVQLLSSWLSVCLQGATWGSEMLFGSSPRGGLYMFTPSLAGRQLVAENHFCWMWDGG